MPSVDYEADVESICHAVKECVKIPLQYINVEGDTLFITLSPKIGTSMEELIGIAVTAECFDLRNIVINRHDIILKMTVDDVNNFIAGRLTADEFLEKLDVDASEV